MSFAVSLVVDDEREMSVFPSLPNLHSHPCRAAGAIVNELDGRRQRQNTLTQHYRHVIVNKNVYPRLSRAVSPERNVSVGLFASWPTVELHRIIRSHIAIQLNDLEQSSHVRNVVDCNLLLAALGITS